MAKSTDGQFAVLASGNMTSGDANGWRFGGGYSKKNKFVFSTNIRGDTLINTS